VLAGKGHETYQIRGTTTYPFDESEIVTELSREMFADQPPHRENA
jgi:UDP-N-acetylmuramoyl-L-alanyl-D-glutamate--2,6-diaminopimelate ligase